jgi:hypothetical protein
LHRPWHREQQQKGFGFFFPGHDCRVHRLLLLLKLKLLSP